MKSIKKAKKLSAKGVSLLLCTALLASSGALAFAGNVKPYASAATADDYAYYSKDEGWVAERDSLSQEIAAEGMVLMQNKDNFLPLTKEKNGGQKVKISVFGKQSVMITDRGYGSSDTYVALGDFYDGFNSDTYNKTFEYNPVLKAFYENKELSGNFRMNNDRKGALDNYRAGLGIWETPYGMYTNAVKESYSNYSDAAVVVLSRYGGEGSDLPTTSLKAWGELTDENKLDSARSADSHYLQLDKNEVEMLQNVMKNFENVIILVNSSNPMELGFLNDSGHYLYTDNGFSDENDAEEMMNRLKSVMYIGFPGTRGCKIIPQLLDGTINPSGHLSDTWERNFMDNPVMRNFGYNGSAYGNKANEGTSTFVHYDEDIYMGYRYYETRYIEEPEETRDEWYEQEMMFPFGYGLSYTEFNWELISCKADSEDGSLKKDGTITTKVKITNVGDVAGKEVVQLYYNAPYYENGIAKAHVVLGEFGKTQLLQPGESEIVSLTTKVSDMYSYDWSDANENGFKGYELEAGTYNITVAQNAHEAAKLKSEFTQSFTLNESIKYLEDTTTGAPVSNLFDGVSGVGKTNPEYFMGVRQYMSRDDFEGTWPTPASAKQSVARTDYTPAVTPEYDADKPWYSSAMPSQAAVSGTSETNTVKLWHMMGRDFDDPLWDKLLDQLTVDEMANLVGNASLHTQEIASIDKPYTSDWDGPLGRRNSGDIQWPSNTLLAQTFNRELAHREGVAFGNAALNAYGGSTYGMTYGVGLNIHRSHFAGRSFEYYSEDGLLSGKMAAQVILGSAEKGNIQTIKHYLLNDQETSRNTVQTWVSEQAIREIYGKAFEIVVKEGNANAVMVGFNSIGNTTCAESWELMTGLLRNEWGFKGLAITDMGFKNPDRSIRAGTNLMMAGGNEPKTDAVSLTPTQVTNLRLSVKYVLYVMANSAIMLGYGGEALDYIEYGGANTLYAVEGVDNTLDADKADNELYGNEVIKYSLLDGTSLPEGMSLVNGKITGAPSKAGEYQFSIVASEDTKARYPLKPKVKNYTLKVYDKNNLPDNIIFEDDDLGIIPYGYQFSKSIDSAVAFDGEGKLIKNVQYSIANGSTLPEGLKLENGVISGVSTAEPGTYFFTVKAESEGRSDAYLDFIVTVKAYNVYYPEFPIEADVSLGDTVSINVANAVGSDGIDVKYALKEGSTLPKGLSLSSNGVISGTAAKACTDHEFTVVAYADMAVPKEVTYKLTVKGIVFDDADLGENLIYKNYTFNLGAELNDGGNALITFKLKNGESLPGGFTLLADGTIYGNTDELGEVSFVVEALADGYKTAEARISVSFSEIYSEEPDGEVASPITGEGNITPEKPSNDKKGLSGGAIAGIVTGSVLGAAAIAAGVAVLVIFLRKKKN